MWYILAVQVQQSTSRTWWPWPASKRMWALQFNLDQSFQCIFKTITTKRILFTRETVRAIHELEQRLGPCILTVQLNHSCSHSGKTGHHQHQPSTTSVCFFFQDCEHTNWSICLPLLNHATKARKLTSLDVITLTPITTSHTGRTSLTNLGTLWYTTQIKVKSHGSQIVVPWYS